MMIITTEQVKQMDKTSITYVDDNGDEQFIDFEACYQQYLERRLNPKAIENMKNANNDFDLEKYIKRTKTWKEIGKRNFEGDYWLTKTKIDSPFIQFHSVPMIILKFKDKDEYGVYQSKIEHEYGWHTFDMT